MSYQYRRQLEQEQKMHLGTYLDMIDEEIEDLDLDFDNAQDRSVLSEFCRRVGLNLYRRCAYDSYIKSTTHYLELWKWWAEQHTIDTSNFDEWWDYKFF